MPILLHIEAITEETDAEVAPDMATQPLPDQEEIFEKIRRLEIENRYLWEHDEKHRQVFLKLIERLENWFYG